MTTTAQESFSILHSIRIKGLATDPVLAAMVGLTPEVLSARLEPLVADHLVVRREGRMSGTMLTPVGKETHAEMLAAVQPGPAVGEFYDAFLPLNRRFKKICNGWQMRDETTPNDHTDEAYDAVRRHFSESETIFLSTAVATINAWNRLGAAFRFAPPILKAAAATKAA